MTDKISDVDAEAKARRWLGGEAAVPRYPHRRHSPFVFNRSLVGLVAFAPPEERARQQAQSRVVYVKLWSLGG